MRTDDLIDQLRELRDEAPPPLGVDPTDIMARSEQRAARRGLSRWLTPILGTAACLTLILGVGLATNTFESPSRPPTAADSPTPDESKPTANEVVDELYYWLDGVLVDGRTRPVVAYFSASDTAITLWHRESLPEQALDEFRSLVMDAGFDPRIRDLRGVDLESPAYLRAQQRISDVLSGINREIAKAPGYPICTTLGQLERETLVLWRTVPDSDLESAMEDIARRAGVELELRIGKVSRSDFRALMAELRDRNRHWEGLGFTVVGGHLRPSGAIVGVTGDLDAARRHIGSSSGVTEVVRMEEITLL